MPVATVDISKYQEHGYITIQWNTLAPAGNYILKRTVNGGAVHTIYTGTARTYVDWWAPSNSLLTYEVDRSSGTSDGVIVPPIVATDYYWLLHPTDPTYHLKLTGVVSDSFSTEREEAVMMVMGRGRHVDYGTTWGEVGSIVAQLRDTSSSTARGKRLSLRTLKDLKTWVWLRNPFGDMWQITLGEIQYDRVAGVGHREDVDVTIQYMEVA